MKTLRRTNHRQAGSVLVVCLLLLLALGGLSATLSMMNLRFHGEHRQAEEDLRAFTTAEAGLTEAYTVLLKDSFAGVQGLAYPRETGTGDYRVEVLDGRDSPEIDLDRVRLRSVGAAGRDEAGVQLMVWHVPTGDYPFAIFGANGVHLNSNVLVDSYDSSDGPYPDKVDFVGDYGNVGSFKSVSIDANVQVHGDLLVAEDGVVDDSAPGAEVFGDLSAGELDVPMPDITVPALPIIGKLTVATSKTLAAGSYHYSSLAVNKGTLTLQGPATLVLDNFTLASGTALNIDSTNGPVKIYATGNVKLASNSVVTTSSSNARDFSMEISSDNVMGGATIDLNSNTSLYGTIYAPKAKLKLTSNFHVYGAVKAGWVEMASNGQIHYDEQLLYDPNVPDVFQVVSWRRLSPVEIDALLVAEGPLP